MSISLTYGGTVETLPPDLVWTDEFSTWSPIEQSIEYGLTGALLIDVGTRQAGRPITLSGTVDAAWMHREQALRLHAWRALPGAEFTLTLHDASTRTVIFDQAKGGIVAPQLIDYADPQAADYHVVTLYFIEMPSTP